MTSAMMKEGTYSLLRNEERRGRSEEEAYRGYVYSFLVNCLLSYKQLSSLKKGSLFYLIHFLKQLF